MFHFGKEILHKIESPRKVKRLSRSNNHEFKTINYIVGRQTLYEEDLV